MILMEMGFVEVMEMVLTVFPIMEMLLRVVVHLGLQKQILLLVPVSVSYTHLTLPTKA